MIHQACCSIWRSSWHFNSLLQWFYSQIRYSYHTYIQSSRFKWLSVSDLVWYIVVCQTDAYPSDKLLPRTAEMVSRLFHENRMSVRPTPDVSGICLSAIEIKVLIAPYQAFVPVFFPSSNIGRIGHSSPSINPPKQQNFTKLPNETHSLHSPNYTHLLCSQQLVECAHLDRSINPKK